jgi:hypothetical protein
VGGYAKKVKRFTFSPTLEENMATIKDVARMAGVSLATVSKYINGGNVRPENARMIAEAITALDFRANPFARSLKMQHSKAVGILLPDISAPFFGAVVTALDSVLRGQGYHTIISCYNGNHALERDNLLYLISTGIQGLIYIPENLTAEEYYELTGKHNVPMVQMDRFIQGVDCDAVMEDNTRIKVGQQGFCAKHFDMLFSRPNKLSVALQIGTRADVITPLLDQIKSASKAKKLADKIDASYTSCVICGYIQDSMVKYYKTIAQMFEREKDFYKTLIASKGFCLHHYAELLRYSGYAGFMKNEYVSVI